MTQLVSKIQLRKYETGEFSNISLRSLDETLDLVFSFPWKEQRTNVSVELTCPSITIENSENSYLKIGPYFSNKFILYFLINGKVYEKIIPTLEDCKNIVQSLFNEETIELKDGFQVKKSLFNFKKHFVTNTFEYTLKNDSSIEYVFNTSFGYLLLLILGLGILDSVFSIAFIVSMLTSWSVLNCVNFYLYFNYKNNSEKLYLQVSQGQDKFVFGENDDLTEYDKKDIIEIIKYKFEGSRNIWSHNVIYNLKLIGNKTLIFNSLILKEDDFNRKFANIKTTEIHKFIAKY